MSLSIIVLSFNTKNLTAQCLQSIVASYREQLEKDRFEVIIVDNASVDQTIIHLKSLIEKLTIKNRKSIHIIENKENFGFSKGNNIGAKEGKGKYLLFLNSDTKLEDEGFIDMINFLDKNEEVGIIGGRLTGPDGSIEASCGNFYNLLHVFFTLFLGEKLKLVRFAPKNLQPVDWVSGGALMIRKHLFSKLGGFDENFFMYVEDMDLCLRAKKLGFLTYYCPNATIMHKTLGSSNRTFAILNIYKGILYFYKKHTTYMHYLLVRILLATKACIAIAVGFFMGDTYLTSTYRKALSLVLKTSL